MTPVSGLFAMIAAAIVAVPVPPGLPSSNVTAHHGTVYQTRKTGQPTSGFMDIQNTGPADTLTAATCAIADTTSLVDASGQPVANIAIPPKQNLTLSATGPHLRLQSTHYTVDYGGIVPCSLIFANAGTISIFLYAEPAP